MTNQELAIKAIDIRKNIVKMVTNAASGHPGGSLSAVEILTLLYGEEMQVGKHNVQDVCRNKFVLSKGHASPVLYATLAAFNLLPQEELMTFRAINSKLQGHPNCNYLDAVDMSTGSLGQGVSAAVGMALSYKVRQLPYRVYALLGDGELQEGQVWEAAMAAAHYKLDNLVIIVDNNGLQIDGDITKVMNPTPIDEKYRAFGFHVIVVDGHNLDDLRKAFTQAKETKGKPTCILAKTIKGKGVPFMENNAAWHGSAPTKEQCEEAIRALEGGR